MSKGNTFENELLALVFQNANVANIGDATGLRGSTTAGSLYASLHSAHPGEAGDQSSSEVSYTGYARVAIARSAGGFSLSGNTITLAAIVAFGQRTDVGSIEATHFGLGTASSGAGKLLYKGPLVGSNTLLAATGKASNDTVTVPGSSYSVNDRVVVYPAAESSLPAGTSDGSVYYIKTASGTDYTLSTTQGGATLDLTADGALVVVRLSTITIAQNTIPQLNTGTKVVED